MRVLVVVLDQAGNLCRRDAGGHVAGHLGEIGLAFGAREELQELPCRPLPPLVGGRHCDDGTANRHSIADLTRNECGNHFKACPPHDVAHRTGGTENHGDFPGKEVVVRGGRNAGLVLEDHLLPERRGFHGRLLVEVHVELLVTDLSVVCVYGTLEIPVRGGRSEGESDAVLGGFTAFVDLRQLFGEFAELLPGFRSPLRKTRLDEGVGVDVQQGSRAKSRKGIEASVVVAVRQETRDIVIKESLGFGLDEAIEVLDRLILGKNLKVR